MIRSSDELDCDACIEDSSVLIEQAVSTCHDASLLCLLFAQGNKGEIIGLLMVSRRAKR